MFEVIVIVCLAATGQDCTQFRFADKQYDNVVTCIRDSHGVADTWQREQTKYTLMGTVCKKDAKVPVAPGKGS